MLRHGRLWLLQSRVIPMVSSKIPYAVETGNFSEQNRELEWPNRELFAPISELKPRGVIEEIFA